MAVSPKTFLGSGKIYEVTATEAMKTTLTTGTKEALKTLFQSVAIPDNLLGYLKDGFNVEVSAEKLEDESDLGEMKVSIMTKESFTASFGLFNANSATILRNYPTAHQVESGVVQVGGLGSANNVEHLLIFHSIDADKGDTVFFAIGKNNDGFQTNWTPGSVTPFQCNYTLLPFNDAGRTLTYVELTTAESEDWVDIELTPGKSTEEEDIEGE